MKRALLFALLTAIWACEACLGQSAAKQEMVPPPLRFASAAAAPAHPSPYNFPGIQYPRIEAASRVTFHFNATNAQKVQVSIANVPFEMIKGEDGVWSYTSAPQAPGYHNYWMLVNGAVVLNRAPKRLSVTATCATALKFPRRAWIFTTSKMYRMAAF